MGHFSKVRRKEEGRGVETHRGAVSVKAVHAVAKWTWDVTDDCCGICRMSFDAFCSDCKL